MDALGRGKVQEARQIFRKHPSVAFMNGGTGHMTPFMVAARHGHMEIMREMLALDMVLASEKDALGMTALMYGLKYGHPRIAHELLHWNKSLASDRDNDGKTALLYAAEYGYFELAEEILAISSSFAADRSEDGSTALMLAAPSGRTPLVQRLLQANTSLLNATDKSGQSALCKVVESLRGTTVSQVMEQLELMDSRIETTRSLLSRGAEYGIVKSGGSAQCIHADTLLQERQQYPRRLLVLFGRRLAADLYFRPQPNLKSVVIIAEDYESYRPDWALLDMYLQGFGPEILQESFDGRTLLMQAVSQVPLRVSKMELRAPDNTVMDRTKKPAVDWILQLHDMFGVPVDQTTADGMSVAMLAAVTGRQDAVDRLVVASQARDPNRTLGSYRLLSRRPCLVAFLTYFAICSVALLLGFLPPPPSGVPQGEPAAFGALKRRQVLVLQRVLEFLAKFLILLSWNFAILYGFPCIDLLHTWTIVSTPWNIMPGKTWLPLVAIAAIGLGFMIYDLVQAWLAATQESPAGDEGTAETDLTPLDIYQDGDCPVEHCLHVFLLTVVFMSVYFHHIWRVHKASLMSSTFWALSVLVQMHVLNPPKIYARRETWEPWGHWCVALLRWGSCADVPARSTLWRRLLLGERGGLVAGAKGGAKNGAEGAGVANGGLTRGGNGGHGSECGTEGARKLPHLARYEVVARFFLSYVSNCFFRALFVYTLPILFAASEKPGDFVLNAVAITFIIELDDSAAGRPCLVPTAARAQRLRRRPPTEVLPANYQRLPQKNRVAELRLSTAQLAGAKRVAQVAHGSSTGIPSSHSPGQSVSSGFSQACLLNSPRPSTGTPSDRFSV